MAIHPIYAQNVASITDLKKDPMGTFRAGQGEAIAILNRNQPAFYCISPEAYEFVQNVLEEAALNALADERMASPASEFVEVDLNAL